MFQEKLKALRNQNGLTQEEVANAIFVSRSVIAKYETGRAYPSKENLEKLALYFGLEVSELMSEEERALLSSESKKRTNERSEDLAKQVEKCLNEKGMKDEAVFNELYQSCLDEYNLGLEKGLNEKEALDKATKSLEETLRSYCVSSKKTNPYRHSLIVSIVGFIICLTIFLIGLLIADILSIFRILYPLLLLGSVSLLVFTIVTYKKRNFVDAITVGILFVSCLAISVECFVYFYRATNGNFYYSLNYQFPGLPHFNTYTLSSMDPISYELSKTIVLFDPTFIASFVCLVLNFILNIIYRKRL